jgi:phospholipid transport system substrate-binding protein
MRPTSHTVLCAILVSVLVMPAGAATPAPSSPADPAAAPVQTLDEALLKSMRAGATATMQRYRLLEPVIEQVFDLPLMMRVSVGPPWTGFSADEQKALIAAFTRYTAANYAHNFRDFSGQQFAIDDVVSRGGEKIVRTRLVLKNDEPVHLWYRMHLEDGAWKIVDVLSDGVSELALRRSDFTSALAAGGAQTLIRHLDTVSAELLK